MTLWSDTANPDRECILCLQFAPGQAGEGLLVVCVCVCVCVCVSRTVPAVPDIVNLPELTERLTLS